MQPSGPDDIITYLNSSTHSLACGETVLKYWDRLLPVTPALAHMGLAYTSAPGELSFCFGNYYLLISWFNSDMC